MTENELSPWFVGAFEAGEFRPLNDTEKEKFRWDDDRSSKFQDGAQKFTLPSRYYGKEIMPGPIDIEWNDDEDIGSLCFALNDCVCEIWLLPTQKDAVEAWLKYKPLLDEHVRLSKIADELD